MLITNQRAPAVNLNMIGMLLGQFGKDLHLEIANGKTSQKDIVNRRFSELQ